MVQSFAVASGTALDDRVTERSGSRVLYQGAAACVLETTLCFIAADRFGGDKRLVSPQGGAERPHAGDSCFRD